MEHELYRQHARQQHNGVLTELIAFDSDGRAVWPAQQLRRALRDQLSSSLTMAMIDGELVGHLAAAADPPLATFEELLHHRHPPLDLLYLVKDYAKLILHDSPGGVHISAGHSVPPPDVALLLYYGSIAAALLRHGQRITSLSDDELRGGFNWATRQTWIDEPTRRLFLEALRSLSSSLLRWRA